MIGKAEYLPGRARPRFVVTHLLLRETNARRLCEQLYCARGDMENRIKEQQLGVFADRTRSQTRRASQLRLYFSYIGTHDSTSINIKSKTIHGWNIEI